MLERSLVMAIDVPTGVLFFTALVAATSAAVLLLLRAKDAAAREHAVAREREAVLKIVRAEMAALGGALVRHTVDLHLVHDLPVPDHVWAARNAPVDPAEGDAINDAPTDTPNSNTTPETEDATNEEDANHNACANSNASAAAADNEDDADDSNDGNDSEGGDTTVEYSMPESTASDRYQREMMIEEYAEERREYAYGDGADWFDAMMRMRQADY